MEWLWKLSYEDVSEQVPAIYNAAPAAPEPLKAIKV
jgi:hypothetical protein